MQNNDPFREHVFCLQKCYAKVRPETKQTALCANLETCKDKHKRIMVESFSLAPGKGRSNPSTTRRKGINQNAN